MSEDSGAVMQSSPEGYALDKLTSTNPYAEPDAARAAAARGGDTRLSKTRLTERFEVPGGMVACQRKNLFGAWRTVVAPTAIRDMSVSGASFRYFGKPMANGGKVRLVLVLPGMMPMQVGGSVAWSQSEKSESRVNGIGAFACGVTFTDFSSMDWSQLCAAHAKYAKSTNPYETGRKDASEKVLPGLDLVLAALQRKSSNGGMQPASAK